MGLLDWVKKRGRTQEPEPEYETPAPFGSTKRGNPIDLVRSDEWRSDPVGVHETRLHLGKSVEGFHGGFQVVPTGGDGEISWSNARQKEEKALLAAQRMSGRWEMGNAQASLDFENNAIHEFERKQARSLQADQKEAGSQESETSSPRQSTYQSKYIGLYDHPPNTEAELRKADVLFDMSLVVQHIARDPDLNVGKYREDFENAVSAMREACGFQTRDHHAEKIQTTSTARDAEMQRGDARQQQTEKGRSWER
jgi:hypothetical protein